MKNARSRLLKAVLAGSVALNLGFLAYHLRAGSFRRLLLRSDLIEAPTEKSSLQSSMEARYRKLSAIRPKAGDIPVGVVFAGDSLIYHGPWSEFYSDIHNRGIPGETSALLLGRLEEVLGAKPQSLVLLIGTNDFAQGVPIDQLLRNYRSILEQVRDRSPLTFVSVLGLPPIRSDLPMAGPRENSTIVEVNDRLEALTREFSQARFVDLTAILADGAGQLRREFTEDGLHLTLDGYLAVREAVLASFEDPDPDPR